MVRAKVCEYIRLGDRGQRVRQRFFDPRLQQRIKCRFLATECTQSGADDLADRREMSRCDPLLRCLSEPTKGNC
jgi:hypothetical protein